MCEKALWVGESWIQQVQQVTLVCWSHWLHSFLTVGSLHCTAKPPQGQCVLYASLALPAAADGWKPVELLRGVGSCMLGALGWKSALGKCPSTEPIATLLVEILG